jgi:MFS family permease
MLAPGLGQLALGYVAFSFAPSVGAGVPTLSLFGATLDGTFLAMVGAMAISGLGSSVTHPTGYPLVSANVSQERKGRALGIWGSASKLGDTMAPVSVAVLLLVLAWQEILLVLGTAGVVYAVVLAVVLGRDDIDTLPLEHASRQTDEGDGGDESGSEAASPSLTDDLRTFVYPMIAVLLFFVTRGVATKGVRTFVPAFVTDVYGYSLSLLGYTLGPESLANFYFSALLLTAAAVQLVAGGLTDRYDHRKVIVALFGIASVGLVLLAYVQLSPVALLAVMLVVGGGIWGANPARDTLVSDISPAEREGRTFGYLWTFTQVLSAASPAVIGYIAGVTGIQDSFKYLALATLLSAVFAATLLSPRVYVERDEEPGTTAD